MYVKEMAEGWVIIATRTSLVSRELLLNWLRAKGEIALGCASVLTTKQMWSRNVPMASVNVQLAVKK